MELQTSKVTAAPIRLRQDRRDLVFNVARTHEMVYLERLLARTRRNGPDGEVIRNGFEAAILAALVEVLREVER